MAFGKHPSLTLQNFYKEKCWQCQDPKKAKVIFLSLDANWAENIEELSIFPEILEYLNDGVSFWEKEGIHHPFYFLHIIRVMDIHFTRISAN